MIPGFLTVWAYVRYINIKYAHIMVLTTEAFFFQCPNKLSHYEARAHTHAHTSVRRSEERAVAYTGGKRVKNSTITPPPPTVFP